jgi:hypothetical protein
MSMGQGECVFHEFIISSSFDWTNDYNAIKFNERIFDNHILCNLIIYGKEWLCL